MSTALSKVEAGIQRLADRDPDRAGEQNDLGFAGTHTSFGHRLAETVGDWSPKQAVAALKICRYYQNTQLADLAPFPTDAEVEADAAEAQKVAAEYLLDEAKAENVVEYGLEWSAPRVVRTRSGLSEVRNALPTELFWAAWRADKEAVKQQGLGLSKYEGTWQVAKWTLLEAAAPVREERPHVVAPLTRPEGLLAYQVPAAANAVVALRAFNVCLDASDTGTGKTYVSLAAFREIGVRPLAVCPKSVAPAWKRAATHLGIEVDVVNYELVRRGNTQWGKWIGTSKARVFQWNTDLVKGLIFDECHRCKGRDTQNSLLLQAAKRQGITTYAASATSATNPLEMKALGYLLGLHGLKDFWKWTQQYGCRPGRWGGFEFTGGKHHLAELHKEIFPTKGGRIRVADLGDAFPETQITAEAIDFGANEKIEKIYVEMEEALDGLKEASADDGESPLTIRLRARQKVELLKVPGFVDLAEDGVAEGNTVLIFVNFRETLDQIVARLDPALVRVIHGDQTSEERQAAIDDIQNDRARILVAISKAGGVGVSLHDVTGQFPRLLLASPSDSAVEMKQVFGRPHRAGGKTKSIQKVLFAAGTVEEAVRQNCEVKFRNLDAFNDGDLQVA